MKKKVLLSGYYGFDNAGDEAVLYAMVKSLRASCGDDLEITVLSAKPEQTKALYQVEAVNRWGKKAIYEAIKNCDLLISGGGSLLQDVTSKNGILYYLGVIKLAQMMKKKVMIYAQGIGPIVHKRNRKLTARILTKVQAITVRDVASRQELVAMGVAGETIRVGVDPVLGIDGTTIAAALGQEILQAAGWQAEGGQTLIVAVRLWQGNDTYFRELALTCDHFSARGWQVVMLPMHHPEDVEAGEKVAQIMHQPSMILTGNYTAEETMAIFKNAQLIIGMRLHALIMGVALGKPVVAVSYDPKIDSFMQSVRLGVCQSVDNLDNAVMIKQAETLLEKGDTATVSGEMMAIIGQQAREPAELVRRLLSDAL